MDSIALSWILRIQELQHVLANTQRELQAQRTRQQEAEALLGLTLEDKEKVQQAALEVQLQKAKLHCAIFELETKGSNNNQDDHTLLSDSIACEQFKLDQVNTKKQRIAAKMKQEQKESQEFSKMMKSLQVDKEQSLADLQLKLSEQRRQTELVRQKAVSLQQSLNESQIEESTLQASLAGYKQRSEHLHSKSKQLDSHVQLLKQTHTNKDELSAKEKLLSQTMIEKRQGEHRLCQEQAIIKALMDRQQQLCSQLEKLKQAVLVLSE
ncbi:TPA: hypothetical protein ACH3X1_011169 [Trebouxia sp. C0004]